MIKQSTYEAAHLDADGLYAITRVTRRGPSGAMRVVSQADTGVRFKTAGEADRYLRSKAREIKIETVSDGE